MSGARHGALEIGAGMWRRKRWEGREWRGRETLRERGRKSAPGSGSVSMVHARSSRQGRLRRGAMPASGYEDGRGRAARTILVGPRNSRFVKRKVATSPPPSSLRKVGKTSAMSRSPFSACRPCMLSRASASCALVTPTFRGVSSCVATPRVAGVACCAACCSATRSIDIAAEAGALGGTYRGKRVFGRQEERCGCRLLSRNTERNFLRFSLLRHKYKYASLQISVAASACRVQLALPPLPLALKASRARSLLQSRGKPLHPT